MYKSPSNNQDIAKDIKDAFSKMPVISRKAIKAINTLMIHTSSVQLSAELYKNIYFYILRGLNTEDVYLKSILYSTIQHLSKKTTESFLAINSLMKDLNSDTNHIIKGKGLITLFSILPQTMVNDFEKFVTQGLVSRFEQRKDASTVVCLLNVRNNRESVKRWIMNLDLMQNIQINDYHALALISHIKDKKFIEKVINDNQKCRGSAGMMLVSLLAVISRYEIDPFIPLFIKFIKSTDDCVSIEACRLISQMDDTSPFINAMIPVLRHFLKSTKKSVKFASMRIVATLSTGSPSINQLNNEIETFVGSENKTLSMMAVTALLQTGNEKTIDRLIETIPKIMDEMSDTYKVIVISALESLSLKFRSKEETFLAFMKTSLQNKGSVKFKRYIIRVMERISCQNVSLSERILDVLSGFIEDSPDSLLSMDIIGYMGFFVGKSSNYKKYIVHIINRLILENASVKCAALQALHLISNDIIEIRPSIFAIISGYVNDEDDFVSTEAKFLVNCMSNSLKTQSKEFNKYEINIDDFHELKDLILEEIGEIQLASKEKEVKADPLIKKTREVLLNNKNDDFNIFLTKFIYSDKIILSFRINNRLEDLIFKSGKFVFLWRDNKLKERVELNIPGFKGETLVERVININQTAVSNLSTQKEYELFIEQVIDISIENEIIFNGNFVFEICTDEDFGDNEVDTISLNPFSINFLDYAVPMLVNENLKFSKSVTLKVPGDIIENKNKIKGMFNLMLVEEEAKEGFNLVLGGKYNNGRISVKVVCTIDGVCKFDISGDDEDVVKGVLKRISE